MKSGTRSLLELCGDVGNWCPEARGRSILSIPELPVSLALFRVSSRFESAVVTASGGQPKKIGTGRSGRLDRVGPRFSQSVLLPCSVATADSRGRRRLVFVPKGMILYSSLLE
jgi:hypothetical protein